MSDQPAPKPGFLAGLSTLQRLTLALAAIVTVAGAGLWAVAAATDADPAPQTQREAGPDMPDSPLNPNSFIDSDTAGDPVDPETGAGERTTLEIYSPTIFRLGFAFFLGFAIAYALRTAFKIVLLVVGGVALLLIGLQMAGLVTVNWDAMEGLYDSSTAWLGRQTESLTAFLSGYIPSGGTAVAGFGIGMLKKR